MGTVLESLVIDARLESAALSRGIAESVRELEGLVARTASISTPLRLDLKLAPVEQLRGLTPQFEAQGAAAGEAYVTALEQELQRIRELVVPAVPAAGAPAAAAAAAPSVSPQALEAFSQASVGAFQGIADALNQLNATVASVAAGVEGFVQGLGEGAMEAVAEFAGVGPAAETAAAGARQLDAALDPLAASITEAATANERLIAGMTESGRAAAVAATASARMIAGMSESGRAAAAVAANTDRIRTAASGASRGMDALRSGLTQIAVSAGGANPAIAQVVSGLLLLGAGSAAVIGVAAGAAILGTAYQALTRQSRERKKALDEEIEALIQRARADRNPIRVAREREGNVEGRAESLRQEIERTAAQLELAMRAPADRTRSAFALVEVLQSRLVKLGTEFRDVIEAAAQGGRETANAMREAEQAVQGFVREREAAITNAVSAAPALGTADAATFREIEIRMAALNRELRTGSLDQETRNRKQQEYNQLLEAALVPTARQGELAQEAARAQLEEFKRLQQQAIRSGAPVALRLDLNQAGTALQQVRAEAEATADRIARIVDPLDAASAAAKRLAGQRDGLRAMSLQIAEAVDSSRIEVFAGAVTTLATRLQALQQLEGADPGGGRAAPGDLSAGSEAGTQQTERQREATAALVHTLVDVVGQLELEQGVLGDNTKLIQAAVQATEALGPGTAAFTAGLGVAITQLREAERRVGELSRLVQVTPEIRFVIDADLKPARAAVNAFFAELEQRREQAALERLNLLPAPETSGISGGFEAAQASVAELDKQLEAAAASSNRFFRQAAERAGDTRTEQQRLNDAIQDTTRGLDSIVGAALNIGLIGDEAARSIGSVLDLGDAIGKVIEKASTGNILGLVGAGLNLVGQAFGPSEAERESQRIQQQNTQALDALRDEISGLITNLGSLQSAERAIGSLTPDDIQAARGLQSAGLGPQPGIDFLNEKLRETGFTLAELDRIAEGQGLDLLDDKGRLAADALGVLEEVLGIVIDQATQFGTSLSDRQEVEATRDALGLGPRAGLPDDVQSLTRTRDLQLQGLELDPELEKRIAGLDLGTEAGREGFLDFNKMLFTMAENGQITAEQLGDFTSVTELLGPINDAATGVNAFDEAVQDATRSLSNIPEFTNLGELEARVREQVASDPRITDAVGLKRAPDQPLANLALDPISLQHITGLVRGGTDGAALPPLSDFRLSERGESGAREGLAELLAALPQAGQQERIVIQWDGDVVVQGAQKSGDELGQEIADYFERRALSTTGRPE